MIFMSYLSFWDLRDARRDGGRSGGRVSGMLEQALGATERLRKAARADDDRGSVMPRLDAQHQVAVVEDGVADQAVFGPQLSDAVIGRLGADDAHGDLMHGCVPGRARCRAVPAGCRPCA